MTLSILIALMTGIGVGFFVLPPEFAVHMGSFTEYALYLLLFFVGIDIGHNKHIFKDLKKHGYFLLIVPFSIVAGSLLGGYITGYIIHMPSNLSLSISAGFGWYSLSGIMLTQLHSAEIGTIAFLTNVMRELIAIVSIPLLAKYLNHYTAIAPAGATSMDTTLPIISRATAPEIVVIAFVNGALLSTLVPVLVPFLYGLM